jgi:hypothetical protein
MGEASIKVNHNGAHNRVVELRDEITRKREKISMELQELRRRRADALVKAKAGAKLAGAGVVGFLIAGSLVNAIKDLFRDDEPVKVLVEKEEEKQSMASMLISILVTMAINEARGIAVQYAREKVREKIEEQRAKAA